MSLFVFSPVFAPGVALQSPDSTPIAHPWFRPFQWMNFFTEIRDVPTFQTCFAPLFDWPVYSDLSYIVSAVLTALAAAWYLHHHGLHPAAVVFGGIALAFSGYHFTLFNAGHRGYFTMVVYGILLLRLIDGMVETGRWPWFVLAALCAVSALRPQPDVFALWCVVLGAYFVFRLVTTPGAFRRRLAFGLVAAAATVALFGAPSIRHVLTVIVAGREAQIAEATPGSETPEDPSVAAKARWDFATSWSLPPSDLAETVAPNLRGYGTGNPEGPFWGETGRSVHYAEDGQGFFNFRQHSLYLGALTVLFALLAACRGVRGLRETMPAETAPGSPDPSDKTPPALILFWTAVALVSLLLAFGRFTPLYRLFYALPKMSAVRGPMKFFHFTEFSMAFLAAIGLSKALGGEISERRRLVFTGLSVAAALAAIVALCFRPDFAEILPSMGIPAAATAKYTEILSGIRLSALLRSAGLFTSGAVFLFLLPVARKRGKKAVGLLGAAVLAVAAADLAAAARPYVNPMETAPYFAPNALTASLYRSGQHDGTAWSNQLAPMSGMHPLAFSMRREGMRHSELFTDTQADSVEGVAVRKLKGDIDALWNFWGTRIVLLPPDRFATLPSGGARITKLGLYTFSAGGIAPTDNPKAAAFGVGVVRDWIPPFGVYTHWTPVDSSDAAWETLSAPGFPFRSDLAVEIPSDGADLPASAPAPAPMVPAKLVRPLRDGKWRSIAVETAADSPAGLLFLRHEMLDYKRLEAFVDGVPAPCYPANVYFRAVPVTAGAHTVELRIALSRPLMILYAASFLLGLAAVAALVRGRNR